MEIAGRYTLDREVGRGGMGAVWLGTDQVLGRQVALKRLGLAPGGTPDLERAEREARLAARLNHPHVVAVFDLVEEDDDHWLVMEYVDGVTLAELVRRDGALTPDQAAPLLRQAAEALAAAHEAGIVHRDVKPSNILVSADGQVKLSDFGIARAEQDSSLTQTGLVTGSPAYLSPEVASGRTAQPAADVWSLGATAYHALSGKPPYDVGDNVMGALYRIVHEEPPRLDDAGWLTPMLEHTMDREPDHRWPMAQVRDFLAGGPVGASAGAATVTQERAATAVTTPVPAPVPAPEPVGYGGVGGTQVLAPTPAAPTPPTPVHRRGPSGAIIGVLLGLGVVLLFLLFAWMFGAFDAQDSSAGDSGPGGGPSSESTGSTPSEPSSSATDSAAQEAAMRDFATSYVQAAVDDPGTSWDLLTPEYQAASGSFGQYKKFWDQWESADVTDVSADVGAGTVSYTVSYHGKKDDEGFVDDVTLELEPNGDGFLIAGAR